MNVGTLELEESSRSWYWSCPLLWTVPYGYWKTELRTSKKAADAVNREVSSSSPDFFVVHLFLGRISLYIPGCPGTHYVDQAILELTEIYLSLLWLKTYSTNHPWQSQHFWGLIPLTLLQSVCQKPRWEKQQGRITLTLPEVWHHPVLIEYLWGAWHILFIILWITTVQVAIITFCVSQLRYRTDNAR